MIRIAYIPLLFVSFFVLSPGKGLAQKSQPHYANNLPIPAIQDKKEIYAGPYLFHPDHLYTKKHWTGQWIWLNTQLFPAYQQTKTTWIHPSGNTSEYRALFRKTINLASLPQHPVLFITADTRFQLYINGSLAGNGPVNTGGDYGDTKAPGYWYYSAFDIRKWLKAGRNTIAIEVFSWGLEWSDITSSFGRLIADLQDGDKKITSTDTSWRATVDIAYRYAGSFLQYKASSEAAGWKTDGFTDDQWPHTSIQPAAAGTKLFRSELPVLLDFPLQPVAVFAGKPENFQPSRGIRFYGVPQKTGDFMLDFSRNRAARIYFDLEAAQGDTVEIDPYEKIGTNPNRQYRYICKNGINRFRSPNVAIFRYLHVRLASRKTITVNTLSAQFSTYPVRYKGAFSCSDDFYTRLWSISRYTTQLCMSDMYFDSPMHQEPIGCTGDYFIESLNSYYAFGDGWLTRQNLIQTALMMEKNDYKMFHTSYSLLWVQMLRQYVFYTGDTLLLHELLPHADKLMQRFHTYLNQDYLVAEAPNYMFMDWITIKGFNAHHPPAMIGMGYLSALLYKAMTDIDYMRGLARSAPAGPIYRDQADSIKRAINRLLWDNQKHLYKDGIPFITHIAPNEWLPADSNLTTYSAHVNTLAVLYGIAPQEEYDRIMDYVSSQQEYELQPYFMSYVLGAMHRTDRTDSSLTLIQRWRKGIDTTTWTLKENWQDRTDFGYSGDYSHAWGGAPLRWLSQDILGISPDAPGYSAIAIHPYIGNKITWAKGSVPLVNGTSVQVSWKRSPQGYYFEYSIPAGAHAVYYLPREANLYQWQIDGKRFDKVPVSFRLTGGQHHITASPTAH